jgi:poly(3-hydroxybutyrate) depolymerase
LGPFLSGSLLEGRDLIAHLRRAHRRPAFGLGAVPIDGREIAVREDAVLRKPFCTLLNFAREARRDDPRVLLVTPLSGQYATLLRDTVDALVPDHDVYVTDWIDAAAVPLAEGRFGLDEMIAYLIAFLRRLGPDVHVLGVCQSGVPVLAAVSAMAAADDPARPRSTTLMGGLIDTRVSPTRMNVMARSRPPFWFERTLITRVPPGYAGMGRRVYSAYFQLGGLITYLARRRGRDAETFLAAFQNALVGDGAPPEQQRRLYDEFLTLMDLPAELYLQTIRTVLQTHALARGCMIWRGRRVDPAAVRDGALMTVEGARDDISAPGQTRAAHDLCANVPARRRLHHEEPEVGHLGLFHGRRWRANILPLFRDFIRANT